MSEEPLSAAEIHWEGDSLQILRHFPEAVRMELGLALRSLQLGRFPENVATRSMRSIGSGVFELKESDERTWYRVLYLSKMRDTIHVLHSFEKNSRKTDQRDIALARTRLKRVLERYKKEQKDLKNGMD